MKQLVFILFAFCAISNAYAQMDCESIPSCAELGYTQDSCAGGKGVRCPFDETKFYCAGVKQLPDAENPGVTDENWSAGCADKINYCTAYNTDCKCTACEDTYLISDGACVPECDKSVDICAAENKTFNSANCTCEACPTNYQFNSETKACEQIACDITKVEHCATYDSNYEPCTCQTCESGYLLSDGDCVPACSGSNKCKDSSGNCITCYSSCSAYNSNYTDTKPSGYTCSSARVMIGAGNGATATSTVCYKCTCSGSNKCLYNTNCVECYPSCSDAGNGWVDEQPSGAICTPTDTKIGSGYGAEAVSKPCYGYCATCEIACSIYAGQANTKAAIDQIGNKAKAAYAASQFYMDNKNGVFGQGKWYLPAIGEWMEFYGTDVTKMTAGLGTTGSVGGNKSLINNALKALSSKGVNAEGLSGSYWSSSEYNPSEYAWVFSAGDGDRFYRGKGFSWALRCSLLLKNIFNPSADGTAPKVGDVMYEDKTWGSVADYDGSKTPVGIIVSISEDGRDVKIINLKNLTFSSDSTTGKFDPENPYGGLSKAVRWDTSLNTAANITGIQDLDDSMALNAFKLLALGNCSCSKYPCNLDTVTCATENKTFNSETCACEACPNNQTFDEEGKFCRTCEGKQKEGTCAVGENFIEWSKYEDGTACGDCVSCLDETDQNNPCVKEGIYKYTCQGGGRYPIGESKCECGTVPYYAKCGVEEQCFEGYGPKEENGGSCTVKGLEDSTYITMSGYYPVQYACTRNTDAKKVYWLASCNTAKDCDGNPGPAYGLKTCDAGTGIGEPVMCGGKKWYESCDPCQEEYYVSANGGTCYEAALEGSYYDDAHGMYRAGEKCTRADGKKVYYIAKCNIEKDCLGNPGLVAGLQDCTGDGVGDPVECRGRNFYESCDTCASSGYEQNTDNGGLCNWYVAEGGTYDNDYGYYRVKEKCTQTTTGKKVYWVTKCNVAKDCAGQVPEAAGLKECGSGEFGYGKVVQCGNRIYADKCLTECNYEKTEADCTSEGKSFVLKCVDNKNQSWGECS